MGVIYKNGIRYRGGGSGGGETIQYSDMPAPSSVIVGKILQYSGPDTVDFTNGYFYQCIEDRTTTPSTYKWIQQDVQPSLTAEQMQDLIDLLEV